MHVHLKVKIKTLTEEAKIIRKEELKAKTSRNYRRTAKRLIRLGKKINLNVNEVDVKPIYVPLSNVEAELAHKQAQVPSDEAFEKFWGLRNHRKNIVGGEARSAHIAYGFLRGKAYREIEIEGSSKPHWSRVKEIALKFGEYLPKDKDAFITSFEQWQEASE